MLAIDVQGEAAPAFLGRVLANDIAKVTAPGKALYSCLLAEDGGILDDLIVYFLGGTRYRLVVNAATAREDCRWLEQFRPAGANMTPREDLGMLAVQGPHARDKFQEALPEYRDASCALRPFTGAESGDALVARTGYTGEDGFELLLPASQAPHAWRRLLAAGVRPCGLGARDTLRLEAGMNLYGQDMDAGVTPPESGLGWTVDPGSARDFIGRRALNERSPRCVLLGLVLEERGGVLRAHQAVHCAEGEGSVTSGSFSPTMQTSIALARLPCAVKPGGRAEVAVRDKLLAVRIVKPPFVRHGRILV
jgi:aminomethyltransferase